MVMEEEVVDHRTVTARLMAEEVAVGMEVEEVEALVGAEVAVEEVEALEER